MGICTEIYKSCVEIYINSIRDSLCGGKDVDEDVAEEEDFPNQLR